jgi:hypothetical protein
MIALAFEFTTSIWPYTTCMPREFLVTHLHMGEASEDAHVTGRWRDGVKEVCRIVLNCSTLDNLNNSSED